MVPAPQCMVDSGKLFLSGTRRDDHGRYKAVGSGAAYTPLSSRSAVPSGSSPRACPGSGRLRLETNCKTQTRKQRTATNEIIPGDGASLCANRAISPKSGEWWQPLLCVATPRTRPTRTSRLSRRSALPRCDLPGLPRSRPRRPQMGSRVFVIHLLLMVSSGVHESHPLPARPWPHAHTH